MTIQPQLKLPQSPNGCPMDALLRLLMGQWTCYILWNLHTKGPMRFGALKREIGGISSKVLTERLRFLEEHGIIYREHVPTIPPQVTYGLSRHGCELLGAMNDLFKVAEKWQAEVN